MVAIQFASQTAAQFWHHIRSVPIATADGGSVFLDQALLADSLDRLGIPTPRPMPRQLVGDHVVNCIVQEVTSAYAEVRAQIDLVDAPHSSGTPIFFRPALREHRWAQGFHQLRSHLNQMVDQRLLLHQHMERLSLLHLNGHLTEERFLNALRALSHIDLAGIEAKRGALAIEQHVVLRSLLDFQHGIAGELPVTMRIANATDLMNGFIASTDTVLDCAARGLHGSAYSVFTGHTTAVEVVDRFVETAKDWRVGRVVATLSVLTIAFGAWQLFGGEAAQSRTAKIASLGFNAVGMIGCSLASPLAIAGTLIGAGSLVMEAREFFS